MRRLNDEILMAYADDALSEADRDYVEAEVARDPQARRLVTLYRSTAAIARHAFDAPMWSDPPSRLVTSLEGRGRRRWGLHIWSYWITGWHGVGGLIVAVSLATCVLLGGAGRQLLLTQRDAHEPHGMSAHVSVGTVTRDTELARALDSFSGSAPVRGGGGFSLIATVTDKWGNTCKEVDARATTPGVPPAFVLVACRAGTGEWTVVGAVAPTMEFDGARRQYYVRSDAAAHDALSGVSRYDRRPAARICPRA